MRRDRTTAGRWDLLGVALSGLCLVHCALLPVVILFLPALERLHHHGEGFHDLVTLAIVPVAALALLPGYLRHRRVEIAGLGLLGLSLMLAAPSFHGAPAGMEQMVALAGGLCLISAHLWNRRRCACCTHAH